MSLSCNITSISFIDKYICILFDHPYFAILLCGIILMFILLAKVFKEMSKDDEDQSPSTIMKFFEILNDVFKGAGK